MGRKPLMAVAFWILPLRILSYAFVSKPGAVVWLQCLDGVGAGIYGVAVVAFSADLTRSKGGFNTLMGLFATALAIGGVVGPVVSGILVERLGFHIAFYAFAALATVGAMVFTWVVPETSHAPRPEAVPEMITEEKYESRMGLSVYCFGQRAAKPAALPWTRSFFNRSKTAGWRTSSHSP